MQQLLDNPFLLLFNPGRDDSHDCYNLWGVMNIPDHPSSQVKEHSHERNSSPSERLWWKHPLTASEAVWIGIAFVWCMVMFFMMVFWHVYGKQNLSTETSQDHARTSSPRPQAMVDKYTVRTETEQNIPVVAPPEGLRRVYDRAPVELVAHSELQKGKTCKLHLTSHGLQIHGFSLQPTNINIQVVPGYEHVIKVTPNESGTFSIVCNEYCGIGHHEMVGRMYVK